MTDREGKRADRPRIARALSLALLITAAAALVFYSFLRLDPGLGTAHSAYAKALAEETDPVARDLLLRSKICAPSGSDHETPQLPHRHCDGCPVGAPAPLIPDSASLPVLHVDWHTENAVHRSAAQRPALRAWPQSRAPPLA